MWKGDGGKTITSFSIITTAAALSTSQYHDRMPLVLDEGQFEDWMRPGRPRCRNDEALRRNDRHLAGRCGGRQREEQPAGAYGPGGSAVAGTLTYLSAGRHVGP